MLEDLFDLGSARLDRLEIGAIDIDDDFSMLRHRFQRSQDDIDDSVWVDLQLFADDFSGGLEGEGEDLLLDFLSELSQFLIEGEEVFVQRDQPLLKSLLERLLLDFFSLFRRLFFEFFRLSLHFCPGAIRTSWPEIREKNFIAPLVCFLRSAG